MPVLRTPTTTLSPGPPSPLWRRIGPHVQTAGWMLLAWVAFAAIFQDRVEGLNAFAFHSALVTMIGVVAVVLSIAIPQIFLPIALYVGWYAFGGTPHLWWDLGLLGAVLVAASWIESNPNVRASWGTSRRATVAFGGVVALVGWVVLSAADFALAPPSLAREPETYRAKVAQSPWPAARVGVALSGGGYRAALLHAGVLDGLEQMGGAPTHLAGVSGGSIIAAYYSQGGRPDRFLAAVHEQRFGLKHRLGNFFNAARLLACPGRLPFLDVRLVPWCTFSRSDVQAQILDDVLLGGVPLTAAERPGLPKLIIGATELNTGGGFGIAPNGMAALQLPSLSRNFAFANAGQVAVAPSLMYAEVGGAVLWGTQSLSKAVAASGAFPGALYAMEFQLQNKPMMLADGGMTDNSAMSYLLLAARDAPKTWTIDVAIASDGSKPMGQVFGTDWNPKARDRAVFSSSIDQAMRGIEIASSHAGQFADLRTQVRARLLLLSPRPLLDVDGTTVKRAEAEALWRQTEAESLADPALRRLLETWQDEHNAALSAVKGDRQAVPEIEQGGLGSLLRSLDRFAQAPTLLDIYPEHQARQIFQLGRFLVALHWRDIRGALESASK